MTKEELNKYQSLANFGNKKAIYKMYEYYYQNMEYEKGFLLLKRFENDLDIVLLNKLAMCYSHGLGVSKSKEMAKDIYLKSYEMGDVTGGYNLALILIKEENYLQAIKYLTYGVYKDHIKSTLLLADLYGNGLGVIKNRDIAISLYNKVLENGDYSVYDKIGKLYYLDKDYFNAFKYFSLGAKKLDPEALYHLGICYCKAEGTPRDIKKAIYYYELGANANHVKCIKNLIFHYENGVGVIANKKKVEYYKKKIANIN